MGITSIDDKVRLFFTKQSGVIRAVLFNLLGMSVDV
jgi:hypothetical protein